VRVLSRWHQTENHEGTVGSVLGCHANEETASILREKDVVGAAFPEDRLPIDSYLNRNKKRK
jgi:hypothetical protein